MSVYTTPLQYRSCLGCERSYSTAWRNTQIPQFIGEALSRDLLQHSQAQEILAALPKATGREMCNSDCTQGTAKKETGYLGSRCPSLLPPLLHLTLPSATCLLWWTETKETVPKICLFTRKFSAVLCWLSLASRHPSTQKDHMKGAYLQERNAYFKLIF